ncbi:hypothetical protein BJY01DRAFT_183995 [Aspergillus pseudoustus]|uniref:Uncharacterized protein n=1 Tax=Aspergillus pseudoustus TaxID=1810923 RepID=A0ABR4JYC7_9EURO
MKSAALILPILLPTTYAWTLTWRNSDGEEHTERGTGPSDCIVIDHAKGEVFELDGEGETNINMLLFSNDECSGEPAGRATKAWTKESSVDLLSFEVVALNGGDDSSTTTSTGNATTATATTTTGGLELNGTLTSQPTGSSTDGTFTLPTVSETETETDTDATMTNTDSESTATETGEPTTTSDSEGGSETETPEATPTGDDAATKLLSRGNIVGAAIAAVAGYAVNLLF